MNRKALIAKVHVGRRDLRLDDDTYRDVLYAATGKASCKDMDARELALVIDHMKARGFDPRPKRKPKGPPQLAKMRALWIALWCLGAVRDRRDSALLAFVRRQTGSDVGALHWVKPVDANKVLEALKDWCAREGFDVPDNGLEAKRTLAAFLAAELRTRGYDPQIARSDIGTFSAPELDSANLAMGELLGGIRET